MSTPTLNVCTVSADTFVGNVRLLHNAALDRTSAYGANLREILGGKRFVHAQAVIKGWPGYVATPLRSLRSTAVELGIEAIHYKDESSRFGLGSFKALGGAYAVQQLLAHEAERRPGSTGIDDCTRQITVTCATDGNHGRSVAWGAQMFGCRCVVFLHETVSEGRANAIAAYGAEVRRSSGNYDDAVRMAARTAAAEHWFVVSDTSYEGYLDIPRDVMQGYAVMVEEALQQLPAARPPTHIFVQGGVGGLAAAVCGHLWERFGTKRPRLVVVEPTNAACLYASAEAGRATSVHGSLETVMAGLSCGEPSLLAWQILATGADDFMTIPDEPALESMRRLAAGSSEDPPIVAGESAVAGLAAALLIAGRPDARKRLDLGPESRVLLFGTEGATDPEVYRRIVGRAAAEVERAASSPCPPI